MVNPQQTQKPSPATAAVAEPKKSAGRKPGEPSRPPEVTAIEALQDAVSRSVWFLSDSPTSSLGAKLARCARAGIPRDRAERGLFLVEQALQVARTQMEAAYAAPKVREVSERPRVTL